MKQGTVRKWTCRGVKILVERGDLDTRDAGFGVPEANG
jgi:hypothetical protein